jgi:hypothetical protein
VASTISRITTGRSVSAGGVLKPNSSMYGQPQQQSEETTLLNPLFSPSSQGSSIQSSPGQLSSGSAAAAAAGGFAGSRPDQMLRHRLSQASAWAGTTSSGEAGSTSLGLRLGTTSTTDGQIASSSATIKAGRSERSGSGVNADALWMLPAAGKDGMSSSIMQQQEKAYLSGTIPAAPGTAAYMAAASAGKRGCRERGNCAEQMHITLAVYSRVAVFGSRVCMYSRCNSRVVLRDVLCHVTVGLAHGQPCIKCMVGRSVVCRIPSVDTGKRCT